MQSDDEDHSEFDESNNQNDQIIESRQQIDSFARSAQIGQGIVGGRGFESSKFEEEKEIYINESSKNASVERRFLFGP